MTSPEVTKQHWLLPLPHAPFQWGPPWGDEPIFGIPCPHPTYRWSRGGPRAMCGSPSCMARSPRLNLLLWWYGSPGGIRAWPGAEPEQGVNQLPPVPARRGQKSTEWDGGHCVSQDSMDVKYRRHALISHLKWMEVVRFPQHFCLSNNR